MVNRQAMQGMKLKLPKIKVKHDAVTIWLVAVLFWESIPYFSNTARAKSKKLPIVVKRTIDTITPIHKPGLFDQVINSTVELVASKSILPKM